MDAVGTLMRNCSFKGAKLRSSDFTEANVSGGYFDGADMVDANFRASCCNGTAFDGADLRSVDFTGAELFGATFVAEDGSNGAIMDGATLITEDQLATMTDVNRDYVKAAISAAA